MKETMISSQHHKRDSLPVLVAALVVSLCLIFYKAWFWDIIDIVTPFLMLPLTVFVWGAFIGVAAWSLIHICRKKRFTRSKVYGPLVIQIVSAVIVVTVPFTSIMIDLNFRLHLKQREEVISKVVSGELRPNIEHNSALIHLPNGYRHLSKGGGDIIVEHHSNDMYVFFFTFRGILDNFSGFMYRSDDTAPLDGDFTGEFLEIKRLSKNWYWTAAQ
jgi:hypothetical protein